MSEPTHGKRGGNLRKIVRPGGLVILDDLGSPSVATAVRYYEINLGWQPVAGAFDRGTIDATTGQPRLRAFRLPDEPFEPPYKAFKPF